MVKFIVFLLLFTSSAFSCDISWQKLPHKTQSKNENKRPQGLTITKDYLVLSNHLKHTNNPGPSQLMFFDIRSFELIKTFSFPKECSHVAGLASNEHFIWAIDFDNPIMIRIDIAKSFKANQLIYKTAFKLQTTGPSGLALMGDLLVTSDHIVPYRTPYLSNRYLQFYNVFSGEKLHFKGNILPSNKSQGLSFFKYGDKTFLVEAINDFDSVLKYWITGFDYAPDIIRIYSIDIQQRIIQHVKDVSIPANMVEDLAFDGLYNLYTTDEQDFHFYKGEIIGGC